MAPSAAGAADTDAAAVAMAGVGGEEAKRAEARELGDVLGSLEGTAYAQDQRHAVRSRKKNVCGPRASSAPQSLTTNHPINTHSSAWGMTPSKTAWPPSGSRSSSSPPPPPSPPPPASPSPASASAAAAGPWTSSGRAAKGKGKGKSKAAAAASSGGGGAAAGGGSGGAGTKKKGAGGGGGGGGSGDGKGKPPRVPTNGKKMGMGQASTAARAAGQQQQLSEEAQLAAALACIAEEGESEEGLEGLSISFEEEKRKMHTPHACSHCHLHTEAAGRRNPRRQARPQRGALLESTEWVLYSS